MLVGNYVWNVERAVDKVFQVATQLADAEMTLEPPNEIYYLGMELCARLCLLFAHVYVRPLNLEVAYFWKRDVVKTAEYERAVLIRPTVIVYPYVRFLVQHASVLRKSCAGIKLVRQQGQVHSSSWYRNTTRLALVLRQSVCFFHQHCVLLFQLCLYPLYVVLHLFGVDWYTYNTVLFPLQ